jgi:hypothetical protein
VNVGSGSGVFVGGSFVRVGIGVLVGLVAQAERITTKIAKERNSLMASHFPTCHRASAE